MVDKVGNISVLGSEWFATHRPVVFSITFPEPTLLRRHMRFPRFFHETGLTEVDLAQVCDDQSLPPCSTLEEWGQNVELVVDKALQYQPDGQSSFSFLPRSFKGRCRQPRIVKTPIFSAIKKACQGAYEPKFEVTSMSTRRKVTQVRRLQSLWHRYSKLEKKGFIRPNDLEALKKEWHAIANSKSFGGNFLFWTQSKLGLSLPSWPLPTSEWILEVLQLAQHETNICLADDHKHHLKLLEYKRKLDQRLHGSRQAFRAVRGKATPPLRELRKVVEDSVCVIPQEEPHVVDVFGNQCRYVLPQFPVILNDIPCKILEQQDDCITVQVPENFPPLEEAQMTQVQFQLAPSEIATALNQFWQPIWQREPEQANFDANSPDLSRLLRLFPPRSEISVDCNDLQLWKAGIRKLRSRSARGVDMIAASEIQILPDPLLKQMIKMLNSYTDGFPDWFMMGIVCPLPKVAAEVGVHQVRPITILSQLYRLWASVMVQQIVAQICTWIPSGVTGLLPKRGAQCSGYLTQMLLEKAILGHERLSGVTLDLVKCFNNINWGVGFQLLDRIGVPSSLLKQFVHSFQRIHRLWSIGQDLHDAGGHTTGYPEGDVWSVLIMISLATAWVLLVTDATRHIEPIRLSAYADNWSWIVHHVRTHECAIAATIQLLQWASLSIDWNKTWYWTTSNQDSRDIMQSLYNWSNGVVVQQKQSALDLGFLMHYNKQPKKGISPERLADGFARLRRVQGLPHDLEVKEHLIGSSVFPAMFHGCEIKPISSDELQQIRSYTADALFGPCYSLSPAVALLLTRGAILDPEFWVLWKVISAARKFLVTSPDDLRLAFLGTSSTFQGNLNKVIGPATAFGFCVRKLGWNINRFGGIHVSGFLTFNVMQCSLKRLHRFAILSWQDRLVHMFTQRKEWFGLPDISRADTLPSLLTFPSVHRRLLTRSLAGGYQVQTQKAKWVEDATDKCLHCDEVDSKAHRLLFCPFGASVREKHQAIVDYLIEEESSLPELPVVHIHPDKEAIQLLQFQQIPTQIVSSVVNLCQDFCAQNLPIHWCVDGSSIHPSVPSARYAGFAAVFDACTSDEERRYIAREYRFLDTNPPTWIPAICNKVGGEQDILRAEMHVIMDLMLEIGHGTIHSDSSVAIGAFNTMFSATSPSGFSDKEHFDLLHRAWLERDSIHNTLVKVKAHCIISDIEDDLQRYWALGNRFANDLALHAAKKLQPDFVKHLESMAQAIIQRRDKLTQTLQLNLDLQLFRAKNPEGTSALTGARWTTTELIEALANWSPRVPIPVLGNFSTEFLPFSAWGETFSHMMLQWLLLLRWPDDDAGPLGKNLGISWAELGLSWMFHYKQCLPVLRVDAQGDKRVVQPHSMESAREWNVTLSEIGQTCKALFDHSLALIPEYILPDFGRNKKISSLYLQGAKQFVCGWTRRPSFPCQRQVAFRIHQMIMSSPDEPLLRQTPFFVSHLTRDFVSTVSWQVAYRNACSARKRVCVRSA